MSIYVLLKYLHLGLALISGIGFALRGFVRLVLKRPLAHPMIRIGPHVIDTLLLGSGLALWVQMQFSIWSWLGVKLILVAAYIGLGIAAFRVEQRQRGVLFYLLALITFVAIAALAVHKPG
ncbi:SirB2 family protein [Wenzhouxiangella marina]|uniref:Invasion gene expression up-regulator, SirB n=1 Tax=Wenzhouxiangella marina TaxID=1579979 RepID=A0A0K0XUM1_9GAMM|nr:SirB2 family protein [Wenzhouxiangella marina]AKS41365.1 Invasion gene expression up-regulator, SirB [Wenzhouxiangella marina]MBB6086883.1 putative membrane protein SirB2 [Wenzhouxiangella marina]